MSNGWICPGCGGAHAPSVLTCPLGAQQQDKCNHVWVSDTYKTYCIMCGKHSEPVVTYTTTTTNPPPNTC